MVAALGETTAGPALPRLLDRMLESPEGRQILKDRPRINSTTVDMNALSKLPENTFGRTYVTWLERCGVTPDTREPVCQLHLSYHSNIRLTSLSHRKGSLYRRSGACVRHAAVSGMPRLLPLHHQHASLRHI